MASRYEETVRFHPVVEVLYLAALVFFVVVQSSVVPEVIWVPWLTGFFLLFLPAMFGRLVIGVDEKALTARFGFLGWPAQRVPLSMIAKARVVSYRPIRQFGGWGIRGGKFEGVRTSVYSVRGTRGVLLELTEPKRICGLKVPRFLVGSQEPERLSAAIGKS